MFRRTNPTFNCVPSRLAKKTASHDTFNRAGRVCSPMHQFSGISDMVRRYDGPSLHKILPECTRINVTFVFMVLCVPFGAGMWPRSPDDVLVVLLSGMFSSDEHPVCGKCASDKTNQQMQHT